MSVPPPQPPPSLDPVAVVVAVLTAWLGPALAHVIGAYFVIIISAAAGSGWALMRRERRGTLSAVGFVALMITTSTLTTVGVAEITNHFLHLSKSAQNFLLPGVALLISGVGHDWARVVPWLADTIVNLILTLKGGGGGYRSPHQPPRSPFNRTGYKSQTEIDDASGATRDEE